MNTYLDFLFDIVATESISISYELAQLTGITTISMPTPVPLPGAAVMIGIGMAGMVARRCWKGRAASARA
jgi:hypothetical protein